jgi:hypothetical protein
LEARLRELLTLVTLIGLAGCCPNPRPPSPGGANSGYVVVGSVAAGTSDLEFYVDHGRDSAILGFAVLEPGTRFYCPMYASTYRGIPDVTLEIFTTDALEAVWVRSSWAGYEELAYHRLGSGECTTEFGDAPLSPVPSPSSGAGSSTSSPPLDDAVAIPLASLNYRSAAEG